MNNNLISRHLFNNILELHSSLIPQTRKILDESNKKLFQAYIAIQKVLTPMTSVEIGAHFAEYSREMRQNFPSIDIIAAEANPYVYKIVTEAIDFNKLNIQYTNIAISSASEPMQFHVLRNKSTHKLYSNRGMGSLIPFADTQYLTDRDLYTEIIEVPCTTGERFILENTLGSTFSLWIDVEGANEVVLKSLEPLLATGKVLSIYIEVEQSVRWEKQWLDSDVTEYLLNFNYVPLIRDAQTKIQYNTIYVHADAIDFAIIEIKDEYINWIRQINHIHNSCSQVILALELELGLQFSIGSNSFYFRNDPPAHYTQIYINSFSKSLHYEFYIDILKNEIKIGLHSEFTDSVLNEQYFNIFKNNEAYLKKYFNDIFGKSYEFSLAQTSRNSTIDIVFPLTPYATNKYGLIMRHLITATVDFLAL